MQSTHAQNGLVLAIGDPLLYWAGRRLLSSRFHTRKLPRAIPDSHTIPYWTEWQGFHIPVPIHSLWFPVDMAVSKYRECVVSTANDVSNIVNLKDGVTCVWS